MVWLRNFRAQVAAGFSATIVMAVAALVASLVIAQRADAERERVLTSYSRDVLYATTLRLHAEKIVAASRGYLLTADTAFLSELSDEEHRMNGAISMLERKLASELGPAHLARIKQAAASYVEDLHRLIVLTRQGGDRAAMARAVEGRLLPARMELENEVNQFVAYKEHLVAVGNEAADLAERRVRLLTLLIGGSGVTLAVAFAWFTARRLDLLYEREKRANLEAQAAVRAREDLLGVVAHDLRNPLNAIVMRSELIKRRSADPELQKSVASIENIALRMSHLVTGLLDAARIEAGHFEIARERCGVARLLASTLEIVSGVATQKRIRITHRVEPQDLTVDADPERIVQVLSNLVGNAVKFSSEGASIEVRAYREHGRARFVVRDWGPGIPPEFVPHLFDRYRQGQSGRRGGAGLGLYIAKGIVEAHGGRIWLEERSEVGSTFYFELPRAESSSEPPRAPLPRAPEAWPSDEKARRET